MGKDFTDGPRGEAERYTKDGVDYHRPQDNRNISGSKAGPLARRLKERRVADVGPPEQGTDSFAGVELAAGAYERMAERGVAHERHPEHAEGFGPAPSEDSDED